MTYSLMAPFGFLHWCEILHFFLKFLQYYFNGVSGEKRTLELSFHLEAYRCGFSLSFTALKF